ncbi:hypothetical protein DUNSADRAFT_7493 [Dunaliella salina]|uniref:Encoded protein n=1 Tax=Dunaliella salina TaxID=3046 RepID=A0ABQ7FTA6_DUNSA|nr:hypothetical protein DUNSADRAFT_7493 [Dunaliella salina]|eukprot:KAF5825704.1 hypothetical protein DUNSADRAFT_7493 [Dunaliella salina]
MPTCSSCMAFEHVRHMRNAIRACFLVHGASPPIKSTIITHISPAWPWCVHAKYARPSARAPSSTAHQPPPAALPPHGGGCPASGAVDAMLTGSALGHRT